MLKKIVPIRFKSNMNKSSISALCLLLLVSGSATVKLKKSLKKGLLFQSAGQMFNQKEPQVMPIMMPVMEPYRNYHSCSSEEVVDLSEFLLHDNHHHHGVHLDFLYDNSVRVGPRMNSLRGGPMKGVNRASMMDHDMDHGYMMNTNHDDADHGHMTDITITRGFPTRGIPHRRHRRPPPRTPPREFHEREEVVRMPPPTRYDFAAARRPAQHHRSERRFNSQDH